MQEKDMRATLVRVLKSLDAKPIENHAGIGTPDMNFIGGWFECKYLDFWPKNASLNVRLKHPLLPEQAVWLNRRCRMGGSAWVCLRVENDWLWLNGLDVKEYLGLVPKAELLRRADYFQLNGLKAEELIEWLKSVCKG